MKAIAAKIYVMIHPKIKVVISSRNPICSDWKIFFRFLFFSIISNSRRQNIFLSKKNTYSDTPKKMIIHIDSSLRILRKIYKGDLSIFSVRTSLCSSTVSTSSYSFVLGFLASKK